jgi:protocatechuate 3,4-dioxygenase beta subunit
MSRRPLLLPLLFGLAAAAGVVALLVAGGREEARGPGDGVARAPSAGGPEGGIDGPGGAGVPEGGDPEAAGPGGAGPTSAAPAGVEGVVLTDEDLPIAGAEVTIAPVSLAARRGLPVPDGPVHARATTDGRGEFALDAPPSGGMRVTASAPGRSTVGTLVAARGARVTLRLPAAAAIRVLVVDPDGSPVGGAEVEVGAGDAILRAAASSDGVAAFEAVAPGPASVRARAEGRAEATAGPVLLLASAPREVTVMLERAVRLGGRVVDAESGEPIAGARVRVAWPGRSVEAEPTGADGTFPPVAVLAPGDQVQVSAVAKGRAALLVPFDLQDLDGAAPTVLLRMRREEDWSGRVVDASGAPAPGARVGYTEDGVAGKAPDQTVADAEGRFALPPPPPPAPGRRVVLVAEGPAAEGGVGRGALALRPGMEKPADLVLTLVAGARVGGRVAGADGAPVAGAEVGLDVAWDLLPERSSSDPATSLLHALNARGYEGLTTATDAAGRFSLAGVPAGTYRPRVESGGVTRRFPDPVTVEGRPVDLGTLSLGTGEALEGRVRDAEGRPLAGAFVRAAPGEEGARTVLARTDAQGRFLLPGLAPGSWRVMTSLMGFAPSFTAVEFPGTRWVDVALDAGAVIDGRVTVGGESRPALFTVRLLRADGRGGVAIRQTFRGGDGRFVLEGVPEGSWFVRADAPGGLLGVTAAPVETRPGARAEVSLALAPSGSVRGRVTDARGRPVDGARLVLLPDGAGEPGAATTDAEGRYAFTALQAGGYALEVVGRGGVPVSERVEVRGGERRDLDVVLPEGGALRVRVQGSDGRPRAGASVSFRGADGKGIRSESATRTGSDGSALREDLPIGRVEVRVRTPQGETGVAGADVVRGGVVEVTVVASRP